MGQPKGMTTKSTGDSQPSSHGEHPTIPDRKGCSEKKTVTCLIVGFGMASFLAIIIIIAAFAIPSLLNARRSAWQSRAKDTLKAIGDMQDLFFEHDNSGSYGTFQDCMDLELIAYGYTLGNMIDNYTMTWDVTKRELAEDGETWVGTSTFTIIAYPLDTRPGYLNTFAIREDSIVRAFVPEFGNIESDVLTWEPVDAPESDKSGE